MTIDIDKIPEALRSLSQWVVWKTVTRKEGDKPTKIPFHVDGKPASSSDPATWSTFNRAYQTFHNGGYHGIGFEFSKDDDLCGIDLDGCREPQTGKVAEWARQIISAVDTYAEVSPSLTGIKLFLVGRLPFPHGKKRELKDEPRMVDKTPAIEVYDWGRYFAVTGLKMVGPAEPQERQQQLEEVIARMFPNEPITYKPVADWRSADAVTERARKYLAKLPGAVSGSGGHNATFHAACVLVCGFSLDENTALALMHEYNQRCNPAWSEKELLHKVRQAAKQPGERGYLQNAALARWDKIDVPTYIDTPQPRITTLSDAAQNYVDSIKNGQSNLVELGLADLDYAIGGGVERGEMIIFAARPSHGKSLAALQCIHNWTAADMPCAIVSEEMSALALGKRTVQYLSPLPQEHWRDRVNTLENEVMAYSERHAKCIVLEGCGKTMAAVEAIDKAVTEHGVQCVVVDYAQLLSGNGQSRYEQMTQVSLSLRQLTSARKLIMLVLCQCSRAIESRPVFEPRMSDIKETGQFEQDADVIAFLCWPFRIDPSQPQNKFQFFVSKNRNRPINQVAVTCHFDPARQTISDERPNMPRVGKPLHMYSANGDGGLPD